MPNHVTNKVEASEKVIKAILNKNGEPDFNAVLPMPESLTMNGEGVNCAAEDMAQLAWCEPLKRWDSLN